MSVSLVYFFPLIVTLFHLFSKSKGLPFAFKSTLSGSFTGKSFLGIVETFPFSSYAIGIGQPQYLCLETPQSFNLKLIFFFPIFFSSNISIVLRIDSSGTLRPLRNFEFIKDPAPEYASSLTSKLSFSLSGFTTVFISRPYFLAKSKSLWSCAGHPKLHQIHNPSEQNLQKKLALFG